ncbi:hypothetical protein RIF29_18917 [Crotalaria pallida]|uniref:Protein FAR1-RELATED SEQUENCE n=1 Tax=Crotalaria pallida TaxID=3830 RepID=A0AAN9I794_CROPI
MDVPTVATGPVGVKIGNVHPNTSGINLGNYCADNSDDEVTAKDLVPCVGMEFETEDHAYKFYNMYAGFTGFSIRKYWRKKSKLDKEIVVSRKFTRSVVEVSSRVAECEEASAFSKDKLWVSALKLTRS